MTRRFNLFILEATGQGKKDKAKQKKNVLVKCQRNGLVNRIFTLNRYDTDREPRFSFLIKSTLLNLALSAGELNKVLANTNQI